MGLRPSVRYSALLAKAIIVIPAQTLQLSGIAYDPLLPIAITAL
jgi:hypothetical protein